MCVHLSMCVCGAGTRVQLCVRGWACAVNVCVVVCTPPYLSIHVSCVGRLTSACVHRSAYSTDVKKPECSLKDKDKLGALDKGTHNTQL